MILGGSLCIARGGEAGCPLRDLTGGLTPLSGQVAGSALSLGMAQTFALKVNGCALTKAVKDQTPYIPGGWFFCCEKPVFLPREPGRMQPLAHPALSPCGQNDLRWQTALMTLNEGPEEADAWEWRGER